MKIKLYTEQQINMVLQTALDYTDFSSATPSEVIDQIKQLLARLEDDGYEITKVEVKL